MKLVHAFLISVDWKTLNQPTMHVLAFACSIPEVLDSHMAKESERTASVVNIGIVDISHIDYSRPPCREFVLHANSKKCE